MFVWRLVREAKVQDETCVHVCEFDEKETFAGKLTRVVAQSLWLLRCVVAVRLLVSVAVCL